MRKRFAAGALAAVMTAALLGASGASAATEIGDPCIGDDSVEELAFFQISSPFSPLPAAAPVAGVITKWKVNLVQAPVQVPQILKVVRITGPTTVQTIAESTVQTITGGANSFDTRLPIQAGDHLGLLGPGLFGTLYCDETSGEFAHAGLTEGLPPVGGSALFEDIELRIPAMAVIEPDADNDGFGDETQDKCPQSAAFQTPCPAVTLDAISQIGRRAVTVLVATNTAAPVSVTATVNLGKGKKATLKAAAQTVNPGQLAKFKLTFNSKLKTRLKELTPKQKLTLKISASATNVVGQISTDKVNAKLKGQG